MNVLPYALLALFCVLSAGVCFLIYKRAKVLRVFTLLPPNEPLPPEDGERIALRGWRLAVFNLILLTIFVPFGVGGMLAVEAGFWEHSPILIIGGSAVLLGFLLRLLVRMTRKRYSQRSQQRWFGGRTIIFNGLALFQVYAECVLVLQGAVFVVLGILIEVFVL